MEEKCMEFYMTSTISADMDKDNRFACEIGTILHRFTTRDWGDGMVDDDKRLNEDALKNGGRILGHYQTSRGKVYVITDDALANPVVTTVLYADEY